MSQPFVIFAATYISVFTLGLQSLNVNGGHYIAATFTSLFIGLGHVLLYRYMPSAAPTELACYFAGGIAGINSSIWFHKRAKAWLALRVARWKARRAIARSSDEHEVVGYAGGLGDFDILGNAPRIARTKRAKDTGHPTLRSREVGHGEEGVGRPCATPSPHVQTDRCGFDRNSSISEDTYVCDCGWREHG